jgi:hypothetical protein
VPEAAVPVVVVAELVAGLLVVSVAAGLGACFRAGRMPAAETLRVE